MSLFSRSRAERDIRALSKAYPLWIDDGGSFVIVSGLNLPPQYSEMATDVLIQMPSDYPFSPPGVGDSHIFLDPFLRFQHRTLKDLHEDSVPRFGTPGFGPWAWFCYERIDWDPRRDDLIKLMEMIRADLTNPRIEGSFF